MISSETPYKLADIIRDTWPGIYMKSDKTYNNQNYKNNERILDRNRK